MPEKARDTLFCDGKGYTCDYRVTSKEGQENGSRDLFALNPKVTSKILTHATHENVTCAVHICDVVVLKNDARLPLSSTY